MPFPHKNQNLGLFVVPTIKNASENVGIFKDSEIICDLRDFAAETLSKNGTVENLPDRDTILKEIETIFDARDFAAETLKKNGTAANFTLDTLSDPKFINVILPDSKAVCVSKDNFRVDTIISPISKPENKAIFNQLTLLNLDQHNFIRFSNFFAPFSYYKFSNLNYFKSKFCVRFHQFLKYKFYFYIQNLGGRGHRFCMTLESRISRFREK